MKARDSYVALLDKQIVGFSDVDPEGHIYMMFVSPPHSRRGVASALLTPLHGDARAHGIRSLSADVSITARPFFEKHGFTVVTQLHPMTAGVPMTNLRMTKMLASAR
jgi:putative acetyltransferase